MANSTDAKRKNYIRGSARSKTFSNGGQNINLSLNLKQLNALPQRTDRKGEVYVQITVSELKSPDQYGNTHAVFEDTWQPGEKSNDYPKAPGNGQFQSLPRQAPKPDNSLPF